MTPKKYRKKHVEIEAMQWTGQITDELKLWLGYALSSYPKPGYTGTLGISTLEGTMTAQPKDWIIRGVQGEFYPVKPDIFASTYEAAE